MKLWKKGMSALLAAVMVASVTATVVPASAETQGFAAEFSSPEGNQSKLKTRYWMPGAWAASSEEGLQEIRREIKEMADAGYGGIELADVRSLTATEEDALEAGNEDGSFLYGSKNWQKVLLTVLQAAKDYGLQVDLTLGPHWPVSSNEITPNDDEAAQELTYGIQKIAPGESFSGIIDPVSVTTDSPVIQNKLKGVYVAKLVKEGTAKVVQGMFNSNLVDREQYTLDKDTYQEITNTDAVDKENFNVTYTNDTEDTYVLISVYSRGTGQSVDGSYQFMDYTDTTKDTGKSCWVVDHLSVAGAETITNYLDNTLFTDEIKQLLREVGGYFFEDSLELKGLTAWSTNMEEEFQNNCGYSVQESLPFVMGLDKAENDSGEQAIFVFDEDEDNFVGRVRQDYLDTQSDMIIENRIQTFSNWANETYGMGYRMQAYGAIVDSGKASAYIDIPEGEPLTFTNESDRYRLMAAGRDMGGKQLLSNEIGASFTYGSCYAYPYDDLLATMNRNMAAGVNQNMLHGYSYAFSPEVQWPGYHAFGTGTSGPWSSRMPSWENVNDITGYINRTQYVLQQGVQKTDIAIYRQEYNAAIWQKGVTEFYYDDGLLADAGYSYQFYTPGLFELDSAIVKDGVLNPEGPGYRAMLVDNTTDKKSDPLDSMPIDIIKNMTTYAQAGLPIVFIGNLPTHGLYEGETDAEFAQALNELLACDTVLQVASYADVPAALEKFNVSPAAEFTTPIDDVQTIRRQEGNSNYYYFFNSSAQLSQSSVTTGTGKDESFTVNLTGSGVPYLLNSWTGEVTPITNYTKTETGAQVSIDLPDSDTTIIAMASEEDMGVAAPKSNVIYENNIDTSYNNGALEGKVTANGNYHALLEDGTIYNGTVADVPAAQELTDWNLTVESWTAGEGNALATNKEIIEVGKTDLVPWSEIEAVGGNVSGIGTYHTTFTLDSTNEKLGAYLKLEDLSDTYSIIINGQEIDTCDQIDYVVDLKDYVKPGENTLEIRVASLLANAIGKSVNSGLMGKVTIQPYATVTLSSETPDPTPSEPSEPENPSSKPSDPSSGDGGSSNGGSGNGGHVQTGDVLPIAGALALLGASVAAVVGIRRKRNH